MDIPGKKTAEAIHQEIRQEVDRWLQMIFADRRKSGRLDLEAVEMALRSSLHHAGAAALNQLLRFAPPAPEQRALPCPCGRIAAYRGLRGKPLLTALGWARIERPYFLWEDCHRGQFPADVELDVEEVERSPGVRRMLALVGEQAPFDQGRQQLRLLAGLEVTAKAVERTAEAIGKDIEVREERAIQRALQLDLPLQIGPRIPLLYVEMDATGVPVIRAETVGRRGKVAGEPARTRDAKLGCVFTQTTVDSQGRPVRDENSTTYVGAIETAEQFGRRLYAEAHRRGCSRAVKIVVLGDGAEWIWNLADLHFPGAIQIVDLYHAREHVWRLAAQLYPTDTVARKRWGLACQSQLDNGKIEKLVTSLRSLAVTHPEGAEDLRNEAQYFENNAPRMRYPQFRRQNLFVGSGVIEAGCKTVIGSRLKQSGMFWTVRGANAIIALRCCRRSGRFEDYWEARRAA